MFLLIADESAPVAGAEATSWVNAAFNVSLAAGAATAGVVVDVWLARGAMLAAAAVAVAVVLASMLVSRTKSLPRLPPG